MSRTHRVTTRQGVKLLLVVASREAISFEDDIVMLRYLFCSVNVMVVTKEKAVRRRPIHNFLDLRVRQDVSLLT